jgi:AcrR family transcriptional regulator
VLHAQQPRGYVARHAVARDLRARIERAPASADPHPAAAAGRIERAFRICYSRRVTRKADPANRSQLLDRIVAYAFKNGVASLSLRPLAKELGVSPGLLLYHFRSKEELTVEILRHAGDRQRELFAALQLRDDVTPGEVCQAVWSVIGAPAARPLFRLFFEVYGLALIDPSRFPNFFPGAISNWLEFLAPAYEREGLDADTARVRATIVLAAFRGFLLDMCATGDDARVNAAVAHWIAET